MVFPVGFKEASDRFSIPKGAGVERGHDEEGLLFRETETAERSGQAIKVGIFNKRLRARRSDAEPFGKGCLEKTVIAGQGRRPKGREITLRRWSFVRRGMRGVGFRCRPHHGAQPIAHAVGVGQVFRLGRSVVRGRIWRSGGYRRGFPGLFQRRRSGACKCLGQLCDCGVQSRPARDGASMGKTMAADQADQIDIAEGFRDSTETWSNKGRPRSSS